MQQSGAVCNRSAGTYRRTSRMRSAIRSFRLIGAVSLNSPDTSPAPPTRPTTFTPHSSVDR